MTHPAVFDVRCIREPARAVLEPWWPLRATGEVAGASGASALDAHVWTLLQAQQMGQHVREVHTTRWTMIRQMGWSDAPNGRQYRRLRATLQQLAYTSGRHAPLLTDAREVCNAADGPTLVLQLLPETPHAADEPHAEILWGAYRMLSHGVPRALYRILAAYHALEVTEVPASELARRLGSRQQRWSRSRLEDLLGTAHAELQRIGVLVGEPEYVPNASGGWSIRYAIADPRVWRDTRDLVVRQAEALGVTTAVARSLAAEHAPSLERALAAATLGMIVPRATLAAAVVACTQDAWTGLPTDLRVRPRLAEMQAPLERIDMQYLSWAADERARRLQLAHHLGDDVVGHIETRWNTHLNQRDGVAPRWIVEGLTAITLNGLLGIESYAQWRDHRQRATPVPSAAAWHASSVSG